MSEEEVRFLEAQVIGILKSSGRMTGMVLESGGLQEMRRVAFTARSGQ